jgi:hypothetical protein
VGLSERDAVVQTRAPAAAAQSGPCGLAFFTEEAEADDVFAKTVRGSI